MSSIFDAFEPLDPELNTQTNHDTETESEMPSLCYLDGLAKDEQRPGFMVARECGDPWLPPQAPTAAAKRTARDRGTGQAEEECAILDVGLTKRKLRSAHNAWWAKYMQVKIHKGSTLLFNISCFPPGRIRKARARKCKHAHLGGGAPRDNTPTTKHKSSATGMRLSDLAFA